MRLSGILTLACALLMPAECGADSEIDRLRAENARLHSALEAKGCASATAAPAATAVPAAATQPLPASPAPVEAAAAAPAYMPPPGYKLVPANASVAPDFSAPPYDKTGCSTGLLKGPKPAPWNDPANWDRLAKDMTMPEVETLIGKDHVVAKRNEHVQWQYGNCGGTIGGFVIFEDGKVTAWSRPEL